jgi:hypothetical protein
VEITVESMCSMNSATARMIGRVRFKFVGRGFWRTAGGAVRGTGDYHGSEFLSRRISAHFLRRRGPGPLRCAQRGRCLACLSNAMETWYQPAPILNGTMSSRGAGQWPSPGFRDFPFRNPRIGYGKDHRHRHRRIGAHF